MSKLIMPMGAPGAGKTTWCKHYLKTHEAEYISRDDIRFSIVKENEEYFSKENEVFTKFVNIINSSLKAGKDVVADATHLNPRSRTKLFSHLNIDPTKTEIIAVVMRTPLEVCLDRNENRKGTRSYVPPQVIKNMYSSFKEPTMKELDTIMNMVYYISSKEEN